MGRGSPIHDTFLEHNHIIVDHHARTAIDSRTQYNLLDPALLPPPVQPKLSFREKEKQVKNNRKLLAEELKSVCAVRLQRLTDANLFE